jgi:hypothetical protein
MVRSRLRAALVLAALAGSTAPLRAEAPHTDPPREILPASALEAPSPQLLARLEQEHVICDTMGDDRAIRALVLFEQPEEEVMQLLTSTTRQKEYRPELTRVEVVDTSNNANVAEYKLRFMLTSVSYRVRESWDPASGRVWWTLDPTFDNGFDVLDGLWELRALDDRRTLGRFSTRIDLGPELPDFLQDFATRKKLPESMEQVRRWVDSGGTWRP